MDTYRKHIPILAIEGKFILLREGLSFRPTKEEEEEEELSRTV